MRSIGMKLKLLFVPDHEAVLAAVRRANLPRARLLAKCLMGIAVAWGVLLPGLILWRGTSDPFANPVLPLVLWLVGMGRLYICNLYAIILNLTNQRKGMLGE